LLSDYVFERLKLHKLYGEIMEDNIGMIRTRFYLGYKQDGLLRDHYIFEGSYKNAVAVSLLEDEYRKVCRPKLLKFISLLR
jgi:RimJ/RimL family protein N-acetyltransferase